MAAKKKKTKSTCKSVPVGDLKRGKKPFTITGYFKKKDAPNYISVDGAIYEKIECKTVAVTLDLDDDASEMVEKLFKAGGYVNRQEAIRDALRVQLGKEAEELE